MNGEYYCFRLIINCLPIQKMLNIYEPLLTYIFTIIQKKSFFE